MDNQNLNHGLTQIGNVSLREETQNVVPPATLVDFSQADWRWYELAWVVSMRWVEGCALVVFQDITVCAVRKLSAQPRQSEQAIGRDHV